MRAELTVKLHPGIKEEMSYQNTLTLSRSYLKQLCADLEA